MENLDVDDFIMCMVPATFAQIHGAATRHFEQDAYRKVDGRLQSLRKRGLIAWERRGRNCIWFPVGETE